MSRSRLTKARAGSNGIVRIIFQETIAALKTWPERKHWASALRLSIPALAIIGFIGFLGGWVIWYPLDRWQDIVKALLIAVFVSALPAELFFRGFLLSALAKFSPRWGAWLSTIAFAAFYPVYGLLNETKWNGVFLSLSFFVAMLVFGVILSHIRIVSRSLWPVIIIHGVAALIWLCVLGRRFY